MKNGRTILLAALALVAMSCQKEVCATCSIVTDAPGASMSKSYCGKPKEITAEDNRLKSHCEQLKYDYPQYSFNCGCY